MDSAIEQNRMAVSPIKRLMVSIGIPIVVSMMLQAVYNIVDSVYLSNMREAGEEALTALGLAFPVQLFMVAVAIGTGVGTNALLSKSLGQGNREKASRTAGNAIFMGCAISIVFLLFGIFGVPAYSNSQNAGGNISETVIQMTIDYLRICCVSFGIVFFSICCLSVCFPYEAGCGGRQNTILFKTAKGYLERYLLHRSAGYYFPGPSHRYDLWAESYFGANRHSWRKRGNRIRPLLQDSAADYLRGCRHARCHHADCIL